MATQFPRNWPGIHPSAWPALNRLAQAVETALNWRTDGSLQIQQSSGSMYAAVPPPPEFLGIILGGNQPYSFAKLTPDDLGVWYGENSQGPLNGHCANQSTGTVLTAAVSGTIATYTLIEPLALIEPLQTVVIAGINPTEYGGYYSGAPGTNPSTGLSYDISGGFWPAGGYSVNGYNGMFQVLNVIPNPGGGLVFQVQLPTAPSEVYQYGGVCCFWNTGDVDYRPAYEENGNNAVPVGTVVRMYPRHRCNEYVDATTDMEFRFNWRPKLLKVFMKGAGRMKITPPQRYPTFAVTMRGAGRVKSPVAPTSVPLYERSVVQLAKKQTISGNVNNYSVDQTTGGITSPSSYVKLNVTTNATMSGLNAANAQDGSTVTLLNVGTAVLSMPNMSGSSSAGNQLSTIDGKTLYLNVGDAVTWKYSTDTGNWNWYWGLCPGQMLRQSRKDSSNQTLTSGTNNTVVAPPTSSWYMSPGSSSIINSMTEFDGSTPQDGRRVLMKNDTGVGSGITITLPNQAPGGSPGFQFISGSGNTVLGAQQSVTVEYKASNLNNTGAWVTEGQGGSGPQSPSYVYYGVPLNTVNGQIFTNPNDCSLNWICNNTTMSTNNTGGGGNTFTGMQPILVDNNCTVKTMNVKNGLILSIM